MSTTTTVVIKYTARKPATANTVYWDMDPDDLRWLLRNMRDITHLTDCCRGNPDVAGMYQSLTQPRVDLPRRDQPGARDRRNSIDSLFRGLIDNFTSATPQRNLTAKQCGGIAVAFDLLSKEFRDIVPVEFSERTARPASQFNQLFVVAP